MVLNSKLPCNPDFTGIYRPTPTLTVRLFIKSNNRLIKTTSVFVICPKSLVYVSSVKTGDVFIGELFDLVQVTIY